MNHRISSVAYFTLTRKEVSRIFRIWTQTLLPPVITQALYFVVFGAFLGTRIGQVGGVSYAAFIVPGLVLMSVVTNAFTNVASSFFGTKFQRSIEEMLVAPMSPLVMLSGFCTGGVVRSVLVGGIVLVVSVFFVPLTMLHVWLVLYFGLMTAICFSLFGFLNGLFARKFDDVGIVPTFVLAPLTYLGGVFYDIGNLHGVWHVVARLNPLAYAIDGFRFGFSGYATTPVAVSALVLGAVTVGLFVLTLHLLRRRVGLQS